MQRQTLVTNPCWIRGFAKKKIQKIQDYYGSWWVGPGLTRVFLLGKSSQNSPKPVVKCLSSIPCVVCKLDLTTFFLYLSKITSNLPENYLSRSKTTSEKSYSSKK